MILEEETFKTFGYYPEGLLPGSSKLIIAKCTDCGKIREVPNNRYRRLCDICNWNRDVVCLNDRKNT